MKSFWEKLLIVIGKPFASRFVAGDMMEDAFRVAKELNKQGFEAIINFLGEEVKDEKQAEENTRIYNHLIKEVYFKDLRARVSIKPSQLGLKISPEFYYSQLSDIARNAFPFEIPLEIDMEGPETIKDTIEKTIMLAMYFPETKIRQAVAVNYKESQSFIMRLANAKIDVRLCKGAYHSNLKEKEIKEKYLTVAKFLLLYVDNNPHFDNGPYHDNYPELATHDLGILEKIFEFKEKRGIQCGFQFLLGLRKRTWRKLKENGESAAIYVPFGTNWLPYAKRRWLYILKKIPSIICGN